MRNLTRVALGFAVVAGLLQAPPAGRAGESPRDREDVTPRGAALLAPFKRELKNALLDGMSRGPAEAIDVCSRKAPEIAAALAVDGVRMGRTSHRLRNPANAAPPWMGPILEAWLANTDHREPATVALGEGRAGYAEPILAGKLCLTCHGEGIAPEIAARISARYPEDRAVGFKEGDLRGAFWVEYPAGD